MIKTKHEGTQLFHILLNQYNEIAKHFCPKNNMGISIEKEIYDALISEHETNMKNLEQKWIDTKTVEYRLNDNSNYGIYNGFSQFDDVLNVHLKPILEKYSYISMEQICRHLNELDDLKKIAYDNYNPYPVSDPELKYADGTYKYNNEYREWLKKAVPAKQAEGYGLVPIEIIIKHVNNYLAQREEKENRSNQYTEKIIAKAKATGKDQELYHDSADCYDPHEECNTDIITTYVRPDGSTYQTRVHTY